MHIVTSETSCGWRTVTIYAGQRSSHKRSFSPHSCFFETAFKTLKFAVKAWLIFSSYVLDYVLHTFSQEKTGYRMHDSFVFHFIVKLE